MRDGDRLRLVRDRALALARDAQTALTLADESQHARLHAELACLLRAAANAQDALVAVGEGSVARWCEPVDRRVA